MRRLLALLVFAVALAGCGGGEEVSPVPETIEGGTTPATATTGETEAETETGEAGTETDEGEPEGSDTTGGTAEEPPGEIKGDKAAGKQVFASAGCGSCHAFAAAGSNGQIGPNLDKSLAAKDADYIRESILDPSAETAEGFGPGIMPENYDDDLSEKQVEDLVAFLSPKS